jgi:hypothetical protein
VHPPLDGSAFFQVLIEDEDAVIIAIYDFLIDGKQWALVAGSMA